MFVADAAEAIKSIKESPKTLKEWEHGFIATIGIQISQGRNLNRPQTEKLQLIHRRLYGVDYQEKCAHDSACIASN